MSVLDSFYILFESDASKLDKGLKETQHKSEKLEHELHAVDKAAEKMGDSFMESLAELGGAIAAALAFDALKDAVLEAADAADELGKQADGIGVSVEELSAWGDAAKLAGGSTEAFVASLDTLSASLAQLDVTGHSRVAPFLKELGIDLDDVRYKGKSALELLPFIADAFEGMSKQQSLGIGRKLGLDQGTIMLLQAGRREIEAQIAKQKELGVVTAEQAKIAAEFNDSVDMARHAFRSVWLEVAESVLPAFKAVMDGMQSLGVFIRKHSQFFVGLMVAMGAAIAIYVLPPLLSAAAAAVVAFAPFILLGAIVAAVAGAFALLYEDIMVFLDGGDSMIGQILQKWPIIGQIAGWIADAVKSMFDVFKWVFETIFSLIEIASNAWQMLFRVIGNTAPFQKMASVVKSILGTLGDAFESFNAIAGAVWDAVVEKIRVAVEWISKAVDLVKQVAGNITGGLDDIKNAQAQIGIASSNPLAAQTSNSLSNFAQGSRSTSVSIDKIEVKTAATDAEGISKAIGGSMQTQMRQAASNFDDGVLA